ncbi:hypothetical protein ACCO45_003198 [Purpureocillium lilacinum]|uniref:Uncharacterized protein n=1 Tax=Purpureocillium lilacinum TaxID=33203 RepID=A0ACC4DZ86_PURLI
MDERVNAVARCLTSRVTFSPPSPVGVRERAEALANTTLQGAAGGRRYKNETLQPWKPEDRYRHSASLRIGKGPIYSGTCNILLLPPTLSTITDRARTKHGDVDTSRRLRDSSTNNTPDENKRDAPRKAQPRYHFGLGAASPSRADQRRPSRTSLPACVPQLLPRVAANERVERRTSAHASLAVERPITLHHRPDHHPEVEPWSASTSTSTSTSSTVAARARTSSARLAQRDKDVACGFGAPPITGGNAISVNARAAITSIIIGTSGGLKGPASKFHNFLGTASPKTNWSTNNSTLDEASDSIATPALEGRLHPAVNLEALPDREPGPCFCPPSLVCLIQHIAASIHTYIQPARTAAAACDSIAIVISVAAHSHPPRHQSLIAIVRLTARPELHAAPPTWPVYALPSAYRARLRSRRSAARPRFYQQANAQRRRARHRLDGAHRLLGPPPSQPPALRRTLGPSNGPPGRPAKNDGNTPNQAHASPASPARPSRRPPPTALPSYTPASQRPHTPLRRPPAGQTPPTSHSSPAPRSPN